MTAELLRLAIKNECPWVLGQLLNNTSLDEILKLLPHILESKNEKIINTYLKHALNKQPPIPMIFQLKLLNAIAYDNAEEIELLLRKYHDILFDDNLDPTNLLALACVLNREKAIKKLLTHDNFVDALQRIYEIIFEEIIESGNSTLITLLRKYIKNYDADNPLLSQLFRRAINENNVDVIKGVLAAGTNPFAPIAEDISPLDLAIAARSQYIILEILGEFPIAKLNQEANKQQILEKLCSCAVRNGFKNLLYKLIVEYNININMPIQHNNSIYSPLELAIKFENKEIIYFLLNRPNINIGTKTKEQLLLLACKKGHTAFIHLVKQNGYKIPPSVNVDGKGIMLIDYALQEKQPEIIQMLITEGIEPQNKESLMLWAFNNGAINLFITLREKYKGVELQNNDLINIWHAHVKRGDLSWINNTSQILKKLIKDELMQNENYKAIKNAMNNGDNEMVKALYPFIGNEALQSKLLKKVVKRQQPELFNFMVKSGAKFPDNNMLLPAIKQMYRAQYLLEEDVLPKIDTSIPPQLHMAYKMGHINTIHYACKNSPVPNHNGDFLPTDFADLSRYLLDEATKMQDTTSAFNLLTSGALFYKPGDKKEMLNKNTDTGYKLLCRACIIGDLQLVKILIDKGVTFTEYLDPKDPNPIELAAIFNHDQVVQYLIDQYRNTHEMNIKSMLTLAVKLNDWYLTGALLELMNPDELSAIEIKDLLKPHEKEITNQFIISMQTSYQEAEKHKDDMKKNKVLTRLAAVSKRLNALGVFLHTPTNPAFHEYSKFTDEFGMPITQSIAEVRTALDELNKKSMLAERAPSPKLTHFK